MIYIFLSLCVLIFSIVEAPGSSMTISSTKTPARESVIEMLPAIAIVILTVVTIHSTTAQDCIEPKFDSENYSGHVVISPEVILGYSVVGVRLYLFICYFDSNSFIHDHS